MEHTALIPCRGVPPPGENELSQELSEDRHSPPLLTVNGPGELDKLVRSKSAEVELTSEKERIKKMLSEGSSVCDINLEAELFTLQDSNAKLVAALQEANNSVEEWKNQLAEYQEETDRLRNQVSELEAQSGRPPVSSDPGREQQLSRSLEELQALLQDKEQEIQILQSKKSDISELEKEREDAINRLQEVESRNAELTERVQAAEGTLASSREQREKSETELQTLVQVLDVKICDLKDLRQSLAKLVDK